MELGKSGGGLCYGYRVRRTTHDGVAIGEREIVPAEAEVVRWIFSVYSTGMSPTPSISNRKAGIALKDLLAQ